MTGLRTLPTISALVCASLFAFTPVALAVPTEPNTLTNALTPASNCTNCHSFGNLEAAQDDPLYAPWFGWQGTMMANSARDPVFWAGVAIASQDDVAGTTDCVRCHAPRAFLEGRGGAIAIDELQPNDLQGVECELCHRMIDDDAVPPGNARYTIDDTLVGMNVPRRGPFAYADDVGTPPHSFIQDPTIGESRLCGTCHDVTTSRERVDDDGVGLGVSFNEQRTYTEWASSSFAQAGDDFRSCQDCHMPAVADMPGCFDNANAGHSHPTGGRRHDLVGANRFMLQLLQGIYGTDTGSGDIEDFFFETSIERMDELLATAATMETVAPKSVDLGEGLSGLDVTVTNESGHKLPTGYSEGRVMWIEVVASYGDDVVWSSGRWTQGTGFEEDDQLRTYRAVAEDLDTGETFHLLRNNHWVEDTRIPPRGLTQGVFVDPIGRYEPLPDGTWPNYDQVSYAFPADTDVVDATPEAADDDVLTVDVRLLYLINTPEYVQFLSDENQTNAAGDDVLSLFEDADGAVPLVLASQQLMIPITGFGAAGESSSSGTTMAADTSGSSSTTAADSSTGLPSTTTSPETGESTGTTASADDGGSEGCGCASARDPGAAWLLVVAPLLRRRRRRSC